MSSLGKGVGTGPNLLKAETFENERVAAEMLVDGVLSFQAVLARLAWVLPAVYLFTISRTL